MKIRTKQDCEQFLQELKESEFPFVFRDSRIAMPNGGATTITMKNGDFYQFSSGQNWADQQSEKIRNPSLFVWKHRKDIVLGMFFWT